MATPPKITIDDLIAHPENAGRLADDQVRDTLKQIADRTSALKSLESQILWRVLAERTAADKDSFPKLLNAGQLAEHLGVPESWVREQARIGELPSIKLGHYVRFRLDDVQRYIAQTTIDPKSHKTVGYIPDAQYADPETEYQILLRSRYSTTWPPFKNFTNRTVPEEVANVLTAWTTVLLAHVVHESGFFSRLRRRLKSTSPKHP
jgi:excisionase family DNA binding protein